MTSAPHWLAPGQAATLWAAIRVNGEVWTLPRPARHHVLVNAWSAAHSRDGQLARTPKHEQGFVVPSARFPTGRFLTREEAAKYIGWDKPTLYSEDLW